MSVNVPPRSIENLNLCCDIDSRVCKLIQKKNKYQGVKGFTTELNIVCCFSLILLTL